MGCELESWLMAVLWCRFYKGAWDFSAYLRVGMGFWAAVVAGAKVVSGRREGTGLERQGRYLR